MYAQFIANANSLANRTKTWAEVLTKENFFFAIEWVNPAPAFFQRSRDEAVCWFR